MQGQRAASESPLMQVKGEFVSPRVGPNEDDPRGPTPWNAQTNPSVVGNTSQDNIAPPPEASEVVDDYATAGEKLRQIFLKRRAQAPKPKNLNRFGLDEDSAKAEPTSDDTPSRVNTPTPLPKTSTQGLRISGAQGGDAENLKYAENLKSAKMEPTSGDPPSCVNSPKQLAKTSTLGLGISAETSQGDQECPDPKGVIQYIKSVADGITEELPIPYSYPSAQVVRIDPEEESEAQHPELQSHESDILGLDHGFGPNRSPPGESGQQ